MLALHVAEQLTMNTYHFIEFLNMVYQWNFTAVEPFVYRSRMFALRSMHWDDINGSVYYHQLLNTSFMKNKLWQCLRQQYGSGQGSSNSSQLFVPLREFLRTSIQRIALVYFPKHLYVLGKDIQIRTDSKLGRTAKEAIVDCTRVLRDSGMSGNVEMLLNQEFVIEKLHRDKYEVVQAFCIMPRVEVSLEQIKKNVLAHVHRDESGQINANVIFVSWQGRFTRPFTDMTTIQHCQLPTDKIPPSQEVASAAESFLDYLGLQKSSYIAVHIRFEKLFDFAFQDMRDPDLFLHCCMQKLDVVLKQLLNGCSNQTTPCKPLLLHDYGPYGSDSCHHNGTWKKREVCIGSVEHLLSMVKVTSPVGFDPIKFAAPKNAGFVSKVEAMSLTDGQSLIVIGGGSFQASVVNRFRAKRKNKLHDYRLCAKADEKFNGINLNDIDRQCVGT